MDRMSSVAAQSWLLPLPTPKGKLICTVSLSESSWNWPDSKMAPGKSKLGMALARSEPPHPVLGGGGDHMEKRVQVERKMGRRWSRGKKQQSFCFL
jgi:hypothetical protein